MKNAINKKLLGKIAVFAIVCAMCVGQVCGLSQAKVTTASADVANEEIIYYDSVVYGDDVFNGLGTQVDTTYAFACDEMVVEASSLHMSAPAYSTVESYMSNCCGPMAGRNVVAFYDRWLTNLIPNYTPGMVTASGIYRYYPEMGTAPKNVMISLYDLMLIPEVGGTTSQNFKNGLSAYASEKGYSASYSSFYSSATNVNLTQLTNAINQNKVGVIMCTEYNFVFGIDLLEDQGVVQVTRFDSTTAHIMMVYGYQTIAFYNDGNRICTKTFLLACGGFGGTDIGFVELNDFSVINEAVIVSMA